MFKDVVFSVLAAIIPLLVQEYIERILNSDSSKPIMILTFAMTIVLFIVLQYILIFIQRFLRKENKYCGQWVEVMEHYVYNESNVKNIFIGIGQIKYDQKTKEYVFTGKTFSLNGEEKYAWSIDYLHAQRDDIMQYVCSVQIPGERSIGQLTFFDKDGCEGTIWVMDGSYYKFNGRRIRYGDMKQMGISTWDKIGRKIFGKPLLSTRDYSEFVREYANKNDIAAEQPQNA